MDKYYIVAQLPTLFFDKESYMTVEYFLREAQKWLSAKEYAVLSTLDLNDTSVRENDPWVLKEYRQFEFSVRRDLESWRKALRAGQEHKLSAFPVATVKEGTPLDVEKKLLKLRWDFIEEREHEHHFDLGFLILYFLKLQILKRLFMFDKDKGYETFAKLCEVEV